MVPLGEVLRHRKEFVEVDEFQTYKRCRVQLHAQGIVLRDCVTGAEIKTKKQQVCRAGEFLVAEIDAKLGGYGIVPDELDGAIVSGHYFLFGIDDAKLDRSFLGHYVKTRSFFEQVAAQGSTNYAAIRPQSVLRYAIPLPESLAEQRRVAARLSSLAQKLQDANRLRQDAINATVALDARFIGSLINTERWSALSMEEIIGSKRLQNGRSLKAAASSSSIRCLTLASIRNGRVDIRDTKAIPMTKSEAEPFLVRTDDVFVVRGNGSKDLVGRAGIVHEAAENVIFPDLLIRVPLDRRRIIPRFFLYAWNSPHVRAQLEDLAKTTSGIWKVNHGHIRSISVPTPPLSEQEQLVCHIDRFRERMGIVSTIRYRSAEEIHALMPAILDQAFREEPS